MKQNLNEQTGSGAQAQRISSYINTLKDLNFTLSDHATVLDFGCGSGAQVKEYRRLGYEAFGCDLQFKDGPDVSWMHQEGIIRLISRDPYRVPFDDNVFDIVVSDEVFEHVQDYSSVLSEIRRVLKPGGASLHIFPARYTPVEPHVFVPLATVVRARWWLLLWAYLGVRKSSQRGLSLAEVVRGNIEYLRKHTHYLSKRDLLSYFTQYFSTVMFCEGIYLRHSIRPRPLTRFRAFSPILSWAYSTFRARVVFLGR